SAARAEEPPIRTTEAVARGPADLPPIKGAFSKTQATKCGYCTRAMTLTAHPLLADNPAPTRADIVDAISANICRCTGYAQIVEAIALAAERMRGLNQPVRKP